MMRWIGVVAVLLWAMSGAWAQAADPSSSFAPFEQWKAAVLAGDSAALKSLYSTDPPARVFVGTTKSDVDADINFWLALKPRSMKTEIVRNEPRHGHNSYIFPERENFNTSEIWGRITLDDSFVFKTDQPILSPYMYGAYDYHKNKGWYFEAGVKHDFVFEDWGLTLTVLGDAAYINGLQTLFIFNNPHDVGFQHYDIGMTANYSLNRLLRISNRYGEWSLRAYLFYTGRLAHRLTADQLTWGGFGIAFRY